MAQTAAQKARHVRQEALREWLSKKRLVEHVIDLADKIEELQVDSDDAETKGNINALKTSAELRLKLINKYLPDLKSTELDVSVNETEISDQERLERLSRILGLGDDSGDRPDITH